MILLTLGIVLVVFASGWGLWAPSAPSAIQTNTFLQPIGSFLIRNESKVALVGVGLIIVAVFFSTGRK